jgi:ligand-binding sensor domain-containing protein/anti-sigma regulatory factor (Ser/Thr protein kinase)
MKYVFLAILVFYLAIPSAKGQVSDLKWHSLGMQDGLSEATNVFVTKDSRGFVWISSVSGLNRFDGTSVKVYQPDINDPSTLESANIQSAFFEDQERNIWFSNYEGFQKYNYDTDCFDQYYIAQDDTTLYQGNYIFYLDPDQYLWMVVKYTYLYTYHIPTGTLELRDSVPVNTTRGYPILRENGHLKRILFKGREHPGITVFDVSAEGKVSHPYLLSEDKHLKVLGIKEIIPEGDTSLWILHTSSLMHYSWGTKEVKVYPNMDGLEGMIRYTDSLLIIGTQKGGLDVFNTSTKAYIPSTGITGPIASTGKTLPIKYLSKDNEGIIWVSTDGVGLHYALPAKKKFNSIHFADFADRETEIKPLHFFEVTPNQILCFTEANGVFEINLNDANIEVNPYLPLDDLKALRLNYVDRDVAGRYWISTWTGLYVFSPDHQTLHKASDTLIITKVWSSPDNHVYSTPIEYGFFEAHFDEDKPFCKPIPGFEKKVCGYGFVDHKNRIWVNEFLKDFMIYSPGNYEPVGSFPMEQISTSFAISPDGKSVYIGTYGGLYAVDEASFKVKKVYSEQSGFPINSIFSIVAEESGKLWLGHSNGIAFYDPALEQIRTYSTEDGLPPTSYTSAACKLKDGRYCFGTIGGITLFYPDQIQDIQAVAIPQITNLQLNETTPRAGIVCAKSGASNFSLMEKIVLPYKENTISFSIHALDYSAPEMNTLFYKMEGVDNDFLEGQNGLRVRYPAMPPGTYHFEMYASNSDGIRNPNPRILELVIKPPYYRTWWFISLVTLTVFSILGYIIWLRFSKKLELQNIRLKLYENLHDDVGSRLTAIVLSAEDLEQNEKISHPKITSISRIARSIVGNMRRLVWAIDPVNDKMMSIVQKINHDKSLILDDDIAFNVEVDDRLKNVVVPGEIRYQISSVCNESFTNIAKYAEATLVTVKILKENKSIKLLVEDNGKGFDPEAKSKNALEGSGYGMTNMKRRAARAGGEFKVYSSPGNGTRIEFQFPFRA